MSDSFQEKFCRQFGVPPDRFGETVLRRTLYWHARWLRVLCPDEFLSADRSFVTAVGHVTSRRGFAGEVREFCRDARNRTFLRRTARLRISGARMNALFREVWPGPAAAAPRE